MPLPFFCYFLFEKPPEILFGSILRRFFSEASSGDSFRKYPPELLSEASVEASFRKHSPEIPFG